MLSPIRNMTKVWHEYGTGFGKYGKGFVPYYGTEACAIPCLGVWHGLVPYYGTEACAIPMARWQARVQNHTLEKDS